MKFNTRHTVLGDCELTDEHPKCSQGIPVLVGPDGQVYRAGDGVVLAGSLHPDPATGYSADYLKFVRKFNANS